MTNIRYSKLAPAGNVELGNSTRRSGGRNLSTSGYALVRRVITFIAKVDHSAQRYLAALAKARNRGSH